MKFDPYPYQQYCIDRIIDTPNLALWLDMGLGKTVITLTALQDLKFNRWAMRRALVIAPKKVAEDTWSSECRKWDHLAGMRVITILGTAKQRETALKQQADVYIINRENTQWLVECCGRNWPFDVVVLDESSSFKNHQAKRFRAMKVVRPRINRVIELTGTPRPHSLLDLWAQMYLLDGGKRLGRTISVYRDIYFDPDQRNRTTIFSYKPKPGAEEAIYQQLDDIAVSMKASDYLDLPDVMYEDVPVKLDSKARKAYDKLERDALLEADTGEVITANTAAVLTGKLLQLCNGAVYGTEADLITPTIQEVHRCKIDAFLETVEQLGGEHALVYYQFQHDRDRLLEALNGSGLRVKLYRDYRDADAWNAGDVDILLAHPASCGYGLNLQYGGHHIIWFGLTWALEQYQQANARLPRNGQTHPVMIHHLVVQDGMDQVVMRALTSGAKAQDDLLEALRVKIAQARR